MKQYKKVIKSALERPRIDTHTHIPDEYVNPGNKKPGTLPNLEEASLADQRVIAEGCRILYGINPGTFIRKDSPKFSILLEKSKRFTQDIRKAYRTAFDKARIVTQLAFCNHHPESLKVKRLSERMELIGYVDEPIAGNDRVFCPDGKDMDFNYFESLCGHFGKLNSFDGYLDALDKMVDMWKKSGVKAIKTAFAYTIGLSFSDPAYKYAVRAFSRKTKMTFDQIRTVQDYAFRHCLLACKRNGLPVVIHTGFQIWGHSNLSQSNPLLLHNLLVDKKTRGLTFVLLHGGNPYTGEMTYLASMFPNVMLDFTWIAWMSRTRFRSAFADWLEMVPKEKFCWGSDSTNVESIVGIDYTVRHLIAETLNESINRGLIDEQYALEFIEDCYYNNPKRIFNL